jgi:hypothetical protein
VPAAAIGIPGSQGPERSRPRACHAEDRRTGPDGFARTGSDTAGGQVSPAAAGGQVSPAAAGGQVSPAAAGGQGQAPPRQQGARYVRPGI